jgi:hypothetical protein
MYFGEEKNPLPEGRWGKSTIRVRSLQASMYSTHKLHPTWLPTGLILAMRTLQQQQVAEQRHQAPILIAHQSPARYLYGCRQPLFRLPVLLPALLQNLTLVTNSRSFSLPPIVSVPSVSSNRSYIFVLKSDFLPFCPNSNHQSSSHVSQKTCSPRLFSLFCLHHQFSSRKRQIFLPKTTTNL